MSQTDVLSDGVEKVFEFDIDIKRPSQYEDIMLVERDTKNWFIIHLMDNGEPVDLSDSKVMLVFSHGAGTNYQDSDSDSGNVWIEGNTVKCKLKTGSFSEGIVECELKIYGGKAFGQTTSSCFNFMCRKSILDEDSVASEVKDSPFEGLIKQARDAIQKAEKAVVDANLALEAAGGTGSVEMRLYLHIRYSDKDPAAYGYNVELSTAPKDYIGLCVTDSPDAPTDPARYDWYRWKGEAGKDGKNSYVHIRYSPIDPATTTVKPIEDPSRYMGVCVTAEKIAPVDADRYEWYLIEGEAGKKGADGISVTGVMGRSGRIVFQMSDNSEISMPTDSIVDGMSSASAIKPGLMSPDDKSKLDDLKAFSGIAFTDSERSLLLQAQN